MLRRPRLTVAIPLHRAAGWLDVVCRNIERAPADTRIVLSDQTLRDDSIARLRGRLRHDPRIRFRARAGAAGWREHINQLIARCRTPLFSILPQDDDISRGYYEQLVAALDASPSAGLAFGRIRTIGWPGREELAGPPFALGIKEPWREAVALDESWNLGIPWRGVIRRELLLPMLPTVGDHFADQIWVFGIALVSHLLEMPDAIYVKRFHSENTHRSWRRLTEAERQAVKLREIDRRLPRRSEPRRLAREHVLAGAGTRPPAERPTPSPLSARL